ncbi:MAG TPA: cellulose biosynthesis cyclic di-GMP-binding regulatory protein BcsB, partial [Herpetosiphonaceae bacterium]
MPRCLSLPVRAALLLGLLLAALRPAPPAAAQSAPTATLDFDRLGFAEARLRGPSDTAYLEFGLPASWQPDGLGELQLNIVVAFAGGAPPPPPSSAISPTGSPLGGPPPRTVAGTLYAQLNDVTLGALTLDQPGEQSLSLPVPALALTPSAEGGRHLLILRLETNERCQSDDFTSIVIRDSSFLRISRRIAPPPLDLAALPRPIIQRSFEPDAVTIVVPDEPSPAELGGALSISAWLGRSAPSLDLALVPLAGLSEERKRGSQIIFVGRTDRLPLLAEAELPAVDPPAAPSDGVIRLGRSPWNAENAVLAATGGGDEAVAKAAWAVSSGAIIPTDDLGLAVVTAIQPAPTTQPAAMDRTFAEAGYASQKMVGVGEHYAGYAFEIAPGATVTGTAYLDLSFVHTGLLDYDQSGLTISLNDEPVASLRLDDASTRLMTARVDLPASALRTGGNQLTVRGDLLPRALCVDPRGSGLWLTIRPESTLHIPLAAAPDAALERPAALSRYPAALAASQNLGELAVVVAPGDAAGWAAAAKIAADMGRGARGRMFAIAAAYADAVPAELRQSRDLLVVGKPAALPILAELAPTLPAPFAPGSSIAAVPGLQAAYRAGAGASVGYLQIAPAPWNGRRLVLAVLGSTDEALAGAAERLIAPETRGAGGANLAVLQGGRAEFLTVP